MLSIHSNQLDSTVSFDEIDHDFKVSAKTSIYRKRASLPCRFLADLGVFNSVSVLNFGKGKHSTDGDFIKKYTDCCIEYDYTWTPELDIKNLSFDVVMACYVLNTLPERSRFVAWKQIQLATKAHTGKAYIAVRSNKERCNCKSAQIEGDGLRMGSTGTFQTFYSSLKFQSEAIRFFKEVKILHYSSSMLLAECSDARV